MDENGQRPSDSLAGGFEESRVPLRARAAQARKVAEVLAVLAAALLIPLKYGFSHPPEAFPFFTAAEIGLCLFFALLTVLDFFTSGGARNFIREKGGETAVLVLSSIFLASLWAAEGEAFLNEHLSPLLEVNLGLNVLLGLVKLERLALNLPVRPVQVFAASFAVLILIGACLLCFLPRATRPGVSLGFLDALFTATSATCVTGLAVVDTGSSFTPLGQTIIAIMIQLGGLGIMTFAAFLGLAVGQGLGLREREMMQSALNVDVIGDMGRIVLFILTATFVLEGLGAAALYLLGVGADCPDGAVWFAVFHSISAFCNAGFCLHSNSYEGYGGAWAFMSVQMALIVLGGLGFVVMRDLTIHPGKAWRRFVKRRGGGRTSHRPPPRISLHTRIVLATSLILIVAGAVLFVVFEWNGVLKGLPADRVALAALFQSVSARTAGFNSVSIGALATPTLILVMILMFIGASPGSAGGGIKTTTFTIMVMSVVRMYRGRPDVELHYRRIPRDVQDRAMVLGFTQAALIGLFILLLSLAEPAVRLSEISFEVVSAFGTVGLSTGLTPGLSVAGKILLTAAMFVGRLGPLTLMWSMSSGGHKARYSYPDERVQIG